MANYRRAFVAGGSYFFTVNLADRQSSLLTEQVGSLRAAFRQVRANHPFAIEAIVILPDHLHTLWTLPEGDAGFPLRWNLIKGAFSRNLAAVEAVSPSRIRKRERGIWQRRYWEHAIRDSSDFLAPSRLHPHQPGEAWLRAVGTGLAVLAVSSSGSIGSLARGLGGRRRRDRIRLWRKAVRGCGMG